MNKLIVLIVFCSSLIAQKVEYADEFLNFGTSARSISLGRAVVALPKHIDGYLLNPAATSFTSGFNISGMYVNQFELADYYSVGFELPAKNGYQWGIHVISLNINDITLRPEILHLADLETRRDFIRSSDQNGFTTFNSRESAVTINIAKNIRTSSLMLKHINVDYDIPYGMNIKLINKNLYNNKGYGIGFDIGSMLKVNLDNQLDNNIIDDFTFGLALTNVNRTKIYWDSKNNEIIPMQLISGLGLFREFDSFPLKISFLVQRNSHYKKNVQYGSELILYDTVALRFGQEYGLLNGGIGLIFKRFQRQVSIDYSFSSHDLGNSHRFGGWISF